MQPAPTRACFPRYPTTQSTPTTTGSRHHSHAPSNREGSRFHSYPTPSPLWGCGAGLLLLFKGGGVEYLTSRGRFHDDCLQVRDVVVLASAGSPASSCKNASSVEITLRGSKTDQAGQSSKHVLLRSDLAPVCPVFAALLLKRNAEVLRLPPTHPVCSTNYGKVLSSENMTRVLRGAATQCGEESSRISTHSLRTGGATTMHSAGFDAIGMHGKWVSDAYQVYIRQAPASRLQLAKRALANNHHAPDNSMGQHEH
ncbi:hypothetical protein ON010_g11995 [Phytophthora cinnamomi]|nr:hypothetical protein ON010_g11995 [Phytophthora cinnamomi]